MQESSQFSDSEEPEVQTF